MRGSRRRILRIAAVGAIAAGLVLQARDVVLRSMRIQLPLQPVVVAPDRAEAAFVQARRGALAGRNVLLVTLDTTRSDRLGCYGNRDIDTPHLDRLAREGVLFSNALATATSTLPTHAAILTGRYPHRTGAHANSLFRVRDEEQTLAEVLSAQGYETAAFVSAFVLDERFGLAQGFDVYDDETGAQAGVMGFGERRGDATTDRAMRWLETAREPFFLWVHYFDPHADYAPPPPFAARYAIPYDGEIAFVDAQLGRLLAGVEAAGSEGPLVVVTADHGEAMGDIENGTHGYLLLETVLRIPLILHAPGLPGGIHVPTRASQVDLVPTILFLLGIDATADLDGVALTRRTAPDRAVLAETVEGRVNFGWARLSALYQGSLKFIERPRPELYDLSVDPLATRDVAASRAADLPALRRRLARVRGLDEELLTPRPEALGAIEIRQLEALGYVVAGSESVEASGGGPDPREMMPLHGRARTLIEAAAHAERIPWWVRLASWLDGWPLPSDDADAIRSLEAIAAEHPDFAPVHRYLSALYAREGRSADAARALRALPEAIRKTAAQDSSRARR